MGNRRVAIAFYAGFLFAFAILKAVADWFDTYDATLAVLASISALAVFYVASRPS